MNLFILILLLQLTHIYCAPNIKIDASADHKPISPYIYGINWANMDFAKEIKLPLNRWGGNAVTRYNWKIDANNRASDWFFENIPNDNAHPENLPKNSSSDVFVEKNIAVGTKSMLTVPLIGWTPKDREKRCGFSVAKYGAQQKTDEWTPDCGNGIYANGTKITNNDPKDTSIAITPDFAKEWIKHLTSQYKNAAAGGVLFYELDNELDLWAETHRDVHPKFPDTEETVNLSIAYAKAIKEADAGSMVLGPVGWGLLSLLSSGYDQHGGGNGADRTAHGNVPFGEWFLKEMKSYETTNKVRILDYFDNHIYPQASDVFSTKTDETTNVTRLRSTRSLWDPTYVDESWIKDMGDPLDKVMFIPRMQKMVANNYPGTKTAITEYNWGALNTLNGALTQADILGIFGREGLDLAALWDSGSINDPWAYAFRMYRNYDGKGAMFGETSVSTVSADQDKLSAYGSLRKSDNALLVIVINKDHTTTSLSSAISISGFNNTGRAHVFRYSSTNLTHIESLPDVTITSTGFNATFPTYSITLYVIPRRN